MDTYDTRIEALKALGNLKVNPNSMPTIEMLAEKIIDNLLKNPMPLAPSPTLEELEDEIKTAVSRFYPTKDIVHEIASYLLAKYKLMPINQ